ncbi:MAG: ABC transporter ATP-binding protein [Bryobacterales bacterium]|nr:ABC transporter ATP-binding protein [Bryobacterales bacterium]
MSQIASAGGLVESAASASQPVLRFQDVSKVYFSGEQSVAAISEVTVTVARGEFVALVGRSGSGKSSFLNLAGAVDMPTSGTVLVNGISTTDLDDDKLTRIRREHVGFVFQFFHLFPTLSVLENIEIPLQLAGNGHPRPRAQEMLDLVDLTDLGGRFPHELSGGQMQRVAIARAMVARPSLLLADEPTGNLDSESAASVLRLFRLVNSELQTTIVMATHSLEAAAEADRILTLRDGRLVRHEQDS